ncbi:MAG TPA: hypothetical protein VKS44_13235, partial [Candidatus Acidoferrales bacterium]|nr:hypothetical protein [Candidatus Acidoferrales bacterium]
AQRESFCFNELLVEMMIVETNVARACQSQDAVASGWRGALVARAAAESRSYRSAPAMNHHSRG